MYRLPGAIGSDLLSQDAVGFGKVAHWIYNVDPYFTFWQTDQNINIGFVSLIALGVVQFVYFVLLTWLHYWLFKIILGKIGAHACIITVRNHYKVSSNYLKYMFQINLYGV